MLRRNVLIFHAGALGDSILTWPLALALARVYPQSRIYLITHVSKGALAAGVLGIESDDINTQWHRLHAGERVEDRAGRLLAAAHTIINFAAPPEGVFARELAEQSGSAAVITINPNPPMRYEKHVTEYQLEQLERAPVIHTSLRQILTGLTQRGLTQGGRPQRPDAEAGILIHPGSGSREKCWPMERFLDLAVAMKDCGRVSAVIGETELERFSERELLKLEQTIPTQRCMDYAALEAAIRGASLFVGNDSGPAHLAGILGRPTVALFGPSDGRVWRPLGPMVRVIQEREMTDISVEQVTAVCRALMLTAKGK